MIDLISEATATRCTRRMPVDELRGAGRRHGVRVRTRMGRRAS